MGGSIYLFLTDSFEIDLYVQGLLQAQGQWLHPGIRPGARHRNCPDPGVPCGVCIFQFNHVLYGKGGKLQPFELIFWLEVSLTALS